jgi:hypothetical protein
MDREFAEAGNNLPAMEIFDCGDPDIEGDELHGRASGGAKREKCLISQKLRQ